MADNFQRASREFPSLARLSRYSLEDMILKGNAGTFDSKKEGISDKDSAEFLTSCLLYPWV
ncbi:MAG: hypothetical protein ACRCV0_04520 [Brevinema sp.]